MIRTNLRFVLPPEAKNPVILVTSCINGDGKSYVSSNIALSLAILGKKVVLVGLDIRKPMLATYFGLKDKGHLTDYLAEPEIALEDIIVPIPPIQEQKRIVKKIEELMPSIKELDQ